MFSMCSGLNEPASVAAYELVCGAMPGCRRCYIDL
jgi:hypothetical protein